MSSETESAGLLASTYLNLSYVCKVQGDLEDSLRLLEKANTLEQKTKDLTGNLITKINKSAIMFELEAFQEAYIHAKEVITLMEPKINEMMRKEVDAELKKNKLFLQNVQLLLAAYVNLISSLDQSTERKHIKEAEEHKNYASRLASRFLDDNNPILYRFNAASQEQRCRHYRQMSWETVEKNPTSSRESDESSMYKPEITNAYFTRTHLYKRNEKLHKQIHFKDVRKKIDSDLQIKSLPQSEKSSPTPQSIHTYSNTKEVTPNLPQLMNQPKISKLNVEIYSPVIGLKPPADPEQTIHTETTAQLDKYQHSPTLVKPKLDLSSSISSAFVTEPSNPYRTKFILMPGQKLPEIPYRASYKRDKDCYRFSKDYLKDYSFLLDMDSQFIPFKEGEKVSQIINSYGKDYAVSCSIVDINDPSLLITTKLIESPSETIIPESLKISDLKSIINFVMIRDILPYDVLIPFINSFVKFAQYFLLPFIRVGISDEDDIETKKIELWGQAIGMLPQEASRVFLRTLCKVSLFQISTTTLRMVLSNANDDEYAENCLRVDLFFDETAASMILKVYESDEIGTIHIPGLRPLNSNFLVHLDPIITELELWVKDEHGDILLQNFIEKDAHIMIRATINTRNLDKTLWIVADDPNSRAWSIRAKNLPSLNSSGRRRKYEANYSYSYLHIIQNYGVKIDGLDKNQRQLIAYYVLQSLRFNDSVDSGIDADMEEDMEIEPMITVVPISIAMSKRFLLEKGYKIPLTLSLIGIKQMIIGVRATILDTDNSLEKGCLFPIDGDFYKPKSAVKSKLSKIPALERLHSLTQQDTCFSEILEDKKGWKKILNVLKLEGNSVYFTDVLGSKTYMDSLENVLYKYKA